GDHPEMFREIRDGCLQHLRVHHLQGRSESEPGAGIAPDRVPAPDAVALDMAFPCRADGLERTGVAIGQPTRWWHLTHDFSETVGKLRVHGGALRFSGTTAARPSSASSNCPTASSATRWRAAFSSTPSRSMTSMPNQNSATQHAMTSAENGGGSTTPLRSSASSA